MDSVLFFTKGVNYLKILFDEASTIIKQHNIYSAVINELTDLVKVTKTLSEKSDRVVLFSWGVIPLQHVKSCCFENVYIYAGQTICKSQQLACLRRNGILVPNWMKNPEHLSDVFDNLGEKVIIKPDEYGAFSCKLVQLVKRDDWDTIHKSRWLYSQYVGCPSPPYKKYRVTCMFGNVIYAYGVHNDDNPIIRCGKGSTTVKVENQEIIDIGSKASRIMTDTYGCGMVGIDMTQNENGIYVIEANPTSIGLWQNMEDIGSSYHKPTNIATACLKELKHIQNS